MLMNLNLKTQKPVMNKTHLIDYIFNLEHHLWLNEHKYIKLHLEEFLERLPRNVIEKVFLEQMTHFSLTKATSACSLSEHTIEVSGDLYNQLNKTVDGWAKGVLAHEVGHIFIGHSRTEDPLEALVDADEFACKMGYFEEIENFLHAQVESVDKLVRMSFVTAYYFANIDTGLSY